MTIRKYVVTAFLALAGSTFVLSAHEADQHKGTPTQGEIATVATDSFQMKTAVGTVKVSFSKDTKIEHGDQVVDKSHLVKGMKLSVFGTKLPSGEIVAKEIVMPGASKGAATEHKH
jgi:hypothetical protein